MPKRAQVAAMPPKVFWDIIEASKRPGEAEQLEALHQMLVTLSVEEIISFSARVWRCLGEANRLDLWIAMDILSGGSTEEDFRHFCCWVISRGWRAFANAIANPDSLGDLPPSDRYELDPLWLIAWSAWAEKLGEPMENYPHDREGHVPWPQRVGCDWDIEDEDELKRRFPRLTARIREA